MMQAAPIAIAPVPASPGLAVPGPPESAAPSEETPSGFDAVLAAMMALLLPQATPQQPPVPTTMAAAGQGSTTPAAAESIPAWPDLAPAAGDVPAQRQPFAMVAGPAANAAPVPAAPPGKAPAPDEQGLPTSAPMTGVQGPGAAAAVVPTVALATIPPWVAAAASAPAPVVRAKPASDAAEVRPRQAISQPAVDASATAGAASDDASVTPATAASAAGDRDAGGQTFSQAQPEPDLGPGSTAPVIGGHPAAARSGEAVAPAEAGPPRAAPLPVDQQVVRALSHAVAQGIDRVHVALEPQDLGLVEITLEVGRDQATHAVIRAERPETLELLQREARAIEKLIVASGLRSDGLQLELGLRQDGASREQARMAEPPPFAAGRQPEPLEPAQRSAPRRLGGLSLIDVMV